MGIKHIVVAADESETSRQAVRSALDWADRLGAAVTVYHVAARPQLAAVGEPTRPSWTQSRHAGEEDRAIERWVTAQAAMRPEHPRPAFESGCGLPGVEIPRFAERAGAGLLVVGRKFRSPARRLSEGDTADAVARRSTVPCLFVQSPLGVPNRILVAADGTDRGLRVTGFAFDLAAALGGALGGVTVERGFAGDPVALAAAVPGARTVELQRRLRGVVEPLLVRSGDPATEILRAAAITEAEVVVIGFRRGGPPGLIEGGSVGRQVAHRASCAVLTVPL